MRLKLIDAVASALMALDCPDLKGKLNSTFEDVYRPYAVKLIKKLKRRGFKLSKDRK